MSAPPAPLLDDALLVRLAHADNQSASGRVGPLVRTGTVDEFVAFLDGALARAEASVRVEVIALAIGALMQAEQPRMEILEALMARLAPTHVVRVFLVRTVFQFVQLREMQQPPIRLLRRLMVGMDRVTPTLGFYALLAPNALDMYTEAVLEQWDTRVRRLSRLALVDRSMVARLQLRELVRRWDVSINLARPATAVDALPVAPVQLGRAPVAQVSSSSSESSSEPRPAAAPEAYDVGWESELSPSDEEEEDDVSSVRVQPDPNAIPVVPPRHATSSSSSSSNSSKSR